MIGMRTRLRARRALACVLALLLVAGLLPVLPEEPRALAEEATDMLVLGDGAADEGEPGLAGNVTGDVASDGEVVEFGESDPIDVVELGDEPTGNDDEGAAVVLDEEAEDALLDQLELVAREDLAADEGPVLQTQSVSVSNPRVRADSSMESGQVATWDCVWFGSYPQTEVAPADAAYASLHSAAWDANGDATVGGVRYRRVSKTDATYSGYWSEDGYGAATWRYFRYEPIKWRALEVSGSTALVVADVALDDQRYNSNFTGETWETSSLRSWLNGYATSYNQPGTDFSGRGFLDRAFDPAERPAILVSDVENADNNYTGVAGGNDTKDKVYLLSEAEVCTTSYGFVADYSVHNEARRCGASDYAHAMGASIDNHYFGSTYDGNCNWWLRSPGNDSYCAACVYSPGHVGRYHWFSGGAANEAVRPAMTLDLKSPCIKTAGTVSSNGNVDEQAPTGTGGNVGDDTGGNTGDSTGGGSTSGGTSTTKKSMTMKLGANATGSVPSGDPLKFFPGDYEAKLTVIPVEFSKEANDDGSVTYKLGVGIGRKDLLDKTETWNQFKANVEDARKGLLKYDALSAFSQGKTVAAFSTKGFKTMPKLGVTGYGEFTYKGGKLVSRAGSVVASASWKASTDWQFWTPVGPVYIELEGGAKAKGKGEAEFDEATSATTYSGSLSIGPCISLEGGYGIASVATIGVNGSAELPIQVAPPTKGEFEAKASLHAYLLFVVDWSYDLAKYHTTLWDTTGGAKAQSTLAAQSEGGASVGTFSEVDRGYAESTSAWDGEVASGLLTAQSDGEATDGFSTLQHSVMPNTVPVVEAVGDKRVAVFQQNDPSSATLDSSVLVYSVLDGGTWSEPRPVWDTGTLDAYADLKLVGDDLYVAWQKERAKVTGDVSADAQGVLSTLAKNSEICVARFDAAKSAFVDAQYVTNNAKLDMMPSIVEGSGEPQVAWVRNTANSLDQSSGRTQLVVARKGGTSWAEMVLGDAAGHVGGIAAFEEGGDAQVAYATVGSDDDPSSASGDVFIAGMSDAISDEGEKPGALQWEGGRLWWATDGLVRAYDPVAGETSTLSAQAASEGEDEASESGTVVGDNMLVLANGQKTSIVWTDTASSDVESSVRSSVVGGDGLLSEPVELCGSGRGIAAAGIAMGTDGTYDVVANTFDAEGAHDLAYARLGTAGSLETMGASAYVADDGSTMLTYGFVNNSEEPVDGYVVTVRRGGEVVEQRAVEGVVAPGASQVGELTFAKGMDASSLSVEVTPIDAGTSIAAAKSEAEVTTGTDLEELIEDVGPTKITSVKLSASSYTYNGKAKKPKVTVKMDDDVVPASSYTVTYKNNVNVGTAIVTVTGKGDYEGTAKATFKIVAASVAKAKVAGVKGKTYTGKKLGQSPKVVVGGRTLKKGVDYALTYKSNVKAGTATMTITGKGNYKGSKSVKFKIAKAANPMAVKAVARTVTLANVKKKAVTVAAPLKFLKKAQGKLTYAKVAKGSSKLLTVNKKTGKVTVRKGTKRGTYSIKVKVTAAGNANYKVLAKTVACKVVVK